MTIRPATEQDIPAITAIYNEVVANSNAVWTEKPDTEADRLAWMAARRALGYPVLVATEGTAVVGYGTFGDFRAWPGYRYRSSIASTSMPIIAGAGWAASSSTSWFRPRPHSASMC